MTDIIINHNELATYFARRYPHHWSVHFDRIFNLEPLIEVCNSYRSTTGRGGQQIDHPTRCLVRGLVAKYLENWSCRQTENHLDRDIWLKWWVGYGVLDSPFDHTTLQRFEMWVYQYHPHLFFNTLQQQFDQLHPELKSDVQIVDTFAMVARAAKQETIELLRALSRRVLRELEAIDFPAAEKILSKLTPTALWGEAKEKPSGLLNAKGRAERLQKVAEQTQLLQQEVTAYLAMSDSDLADSPLAEWLGHLSKVLRSEVKFETAATGEVIITEKAHDDKGSYRIMSASDPDATYRLHGTQPGVLGYNVSLLTDGDFIRTVQVDTGAQPDNVALPDLLATQKEDQHFMPRQLLGDQAYGTGQVRANVAKVTDNYTQLVAKIPPYESRTHLFGPTDFELDESDPAKPRLICPQGRSTTDSSNNPNRPGRDFRFTAKICVDCPLWNQCRQETSNPKGRRSVFISDHRDVVAQARLFNATPAFKELMPQRWPIERHIAHLTQYYGARHAKGVGRARADYQAHMAAMAYNVQRGLRLHAAALAEG